MIEEKSYEVRFKTLTAKRSVVKQLPLRYGVTVWELEQNEVQFLGWFYSELVGGRRGEKSVLMLNKDGTPAVLTSPILGKIEGTSSMTYAHFVVPHIVLT